MLFILLATLLQGGAVAAGPEVKPAATVVSPEWIRRPDGDDLYRHYPPSAMRKGLPGRATISCGVSADGLLTNCAVAEESPVGEGFGDAAIKMAPLFKMRPQTRDGQPVEGGTVRIPLRFIADNRMDPLSAMLACYGQTAAAAEKDPANEAAIATYGFFAAQVAVRQAAAKGKPEELEAGLRSARLGALSPHAQLSPSLRDCLEFAKKGAR